MTTVHEATNHYLSFKKAKRGELEEQNIPAKTQVRLSGKKNTPEESNPEQGNMNLHQEEEPHQSYWSRLSSKQQTCTKVILVAFAIAILMLLGALIVSRMMKPTVIVIRRQTTPLPNTQTVLKQSTVVLEDKNLIEPSVKIQAVILSSEDTSTIRTLQEQNPTSEALPQTTQKTSIIVQNPQDSGITLTSFDPETHQILIDVDKLFINSLKSDSARLLFESRSLQTDQSIPEVNGFNFDDGKALLQSISQAVLEVSAKVLQVPQSELELKYEEHFQGTLNSKGTAYDLDFPNPTPKRRLLDTDFSAVFAKAVVTKALQGALEQAVNNVVVFGDQLAAAAEEKFTNDISTVVEEVTQQTVPARLLAETVTNDSPSSNDTSSATSNSSNTTNTTSNTTSTNATSNTTQNSTSTNTTSNSTSTNTTTSNSTSNSTAKNTTRNRRSWKRISRCVRRKCSRRRIIKNSTHNAMTKCYRRFRRVRCEKSTFNSTDSPYEISKETKQNITQKNKPSTKAYMRVTRKIKGKASITIG